MGASIGQFGMVRLMVVGNRGFVDGKVEGPLQAFGNALFTPHLPGDVARNKFCLYRSPFVQQLLRPFSTADILFFSQIHVTRVTCFPRKEMPSVLASEAWPQVAELRPPNISSIVPPNWERLVGFGNPVLVDLSADNFVEEVMLTG